MTDHLDRAAAIVGGCCAHCDDLVDERLALLDEAGLLASPERDAEVRADERGRCSVVHATLTDEALVDELVRRGVLREEVRRLDDGMAYTTRDREGVVRTGGRPQTKQRRYVTAWEPIEGDA